MKGLMKSLAVKLAAQRAMAYWHDEYVEKRRRWIAQHVGLTYWKGFTKYTVDADLAERCFDAYVGTSLPFFANAGSGWTVTKRHNICNRLVGLTAEDLPEDVILDEEEILAIQPGLTEDAE